MIYSNLPKFRDKLRQSIEMNDSLLCVGIDPTTKNAFNDIRQLVFDTSRYVCAYKLNLAFFLCQPGLIEYALNVIPSYIPTILDAKFGDIGNTSDRYAEYAFDKLKVNAVTVSPYLGEDTIKSFSKYKDKGVFVLTQTTNNSANQIQNVRDDSNNRWLRVYEKAAEMAHFNDVDVVVGGNYERIRRMTPDSIFLCPGIGEQGLGLEEPLSALNKEKNNVIISASRSIANSADPGRAAMELKMRINEIRFRN